MAQKKKSILIVDDSPALLEVLTVAFQEAGYEVSYAIDGEEVFRKMSGSDPDALLLDIYMPKINGADVCRLVKGHPHWKKIYLVMMSARVSDKEIETYRKIGADEVLRKPFEPADVVKLVDQAIEKASAKTVDKS